MKNQKLWFKAKNFGWGWTPINWKGWAVTLLYVASILVHIQNIDLQTHTMSDIFMNFILPFVINTIFLLIICYAHGERPRWKWGKK